MRKRRGREEEERRKRDEVRREEVEAFVSLLRCSSHAYFRLSLPRQRGEVEVSDAGNFETPFAHHHAVCMFQY